MNRLGNRKPRKIQRGRGASRSQPSRPILLRAIEQGVLILLLMGIATWGTEWLTDPQNLPLREVSIEGQFQHTTKQKISETVTSHITGGFFSVDLDKIQTAVEGLSWVSQVKVRRIWPDGLQIQAKEQVPLARWGENALVSVEGKIFTPPQESFPKGLPKLEGPLGGEHLLVKRFREIQKQLNPFKLRAVQLIIGERRDCRIVFDNNIELVLGRTYNKQRLAQFLRVYTHLLQLHQEDIKQIDMRYTNGFAVTWRGGAAPAWIREAVLDA